MLDSTGHSDEDFQETELPSGGSNTTPPWSATTKLVVALSLVALLASLVISFRNIVGPLLLSFVLSYLLYPAADRMRRHFHISWKISVNLIYLFAVILIFGLLFWGAVTLVEQVQSLLTFLEKWVGTIPELLDQLALVRYQLGPLRD
jgi:predicted PurR-regulated permease PerM